MEVDDQSDRVSEKEVKMGYIDTDVLQVEFVPTKKSRYWTAIYYPYSFPEWTSFTLDVYREKLPNKFDDNDDNEQTIDDNVDKRDDWYSLNLLCPQCISKVEISLHDSITTIHKFDTTSYGGDTPCTGTIKWKVIYDDADTLIYRVKKCVWSFHTSNVHQYN